MDLRNLSGSGLDILSADGYDELDPNVYIRAAQRIEKERNVLSCVAIWNATFLAPIEHSMKYEMLFDNADWWGSSLPHKEERVMALLMMAAIVEAG